MRSKAATIRQVIERKMEGCWPSCSRRKVMGASAARRAFSCRTHRTPYREEGLLLGRAGELEAVEDGLERAITQAVVGPVPAAEPGQRRGRGRSGDGTQQHGGEA